jgi:hypothetical protein
MPKIGALTERVVAYLPLLGTTIILVIQNFFPKFLSDFNLQLSLATMATSFILITWFLDSRMSKFANGFGLLGERVDALAEQQPRILGAASSNFRLVSLAEGFKSAADSLIRIEHLRVFAASGSQMHTFIQHSRLTIDNCSLLLQRPEDLHSSYARAIDQVIVRWQLLVRIGRIRRLEILRYNFSPTEYQCIFDSQYLIHGLFRPNDYEESGLTVLDPMIVNGEALSGAALIEAYVTRYDTMFEYCRAGYGPNDEVTLYESPDGRLK